MSDSQAKTDPAKNKNSRANVILFALMVSLICSLMITAAATGLKGCSKKTSPWTERSTCSGPPVWSPPGEKPPGEEISGLYDRRIREVAVDNQGKILDQDKIREQDKEGMRIYLILSAEAPDQVAGYILPINTRGLWGRIHGYLAFENDGQTVAGFSVYSHSETPGPGRRDRKRLVPEKLQG